MPVGKPTVSNLSKENTSVFITACKYGHIYLVSEQLKGISRVTLDMFKYFYTLALGMNHSTKHNYFLKSKTQ